MNENGGKSSTILLTVIGIATLLVVVTGATFAFFAANLTGNDNKTSIRVQAASTGTTITFQGGETITNLVGIYPRDEAWVTKDITLKSTAVGDATSNATSKYTFKLVVAENGYDTGDIQYTFVNKKATNVNTDFTQVASKTNLAASDDIAHGIVPNNKAAEIVYTLSIYYVNNPDKNQNNGSERKLKIYVDYDWTAETQG